MTRNLHFTGIIFSNFNRALKRPNVFLNIQHDYMYYINGFIRRLMETAGLEKHYFRPNLTDSQFAYIHRRDITHINDYTNQISKYVDVEYGQVRL
jgi:hypothetical protein